MFPLELLITNFHHFLLFYLSDENVCLYCICAIIRNRETKCDFPRGNIEKRGKKRRNWRTLDFSAGSTREIREGKMYERKSLISHTVAV